MSKMVLVHSVELTTITQVGLIGDPGTVSVGGQDINSTLVQNISNPSQPQSYRM